MIKLTFECDGPGCSASHTMALDAETLENLHGAPIVPPRWVNRRVFETAQAVSELTYVDRRFCYCEVCARVEPSLPVPVAEKISQVLAQTVGIAPASQASGASPS